MIRRTPNSDSVLQLAESLFKQDEKLWKKLYAEDDRKHGGAGTGTSWAPQTMSAGGASP